MHSYHINATFLRLIPHSTTIATLDNKKFGVKKLLRVVLGDFLCTGHVILRMRSKLGSLHNGKTLFFAYKMA